MHDAVFRTRSLTPLLCANPARRLQEVISVEDRWELFKPLAEPGTAGTRQSETSRDRVISTCGRGYLVGVVQGAA